MPHFITLETIDKDIHRLGIKTIELQYLDPTGDIHSMILSATKLSFIDGEYKLVANDIAGTLDGSSIPGFQNIDKTGLEIVPGPNPRIYLDPTDSSRLVVMGNTKEPNGPLYAKDPRNQALIAEQWLLQQDLGLKALRIGPEFEFFVFPKGSDPLDFDADNTNYHCSAANNPNQAFMEDYLAALQLAGVDSRFFHAEVASHQNEVGVNCETLLRAADNVIIQRDILKKLAVKYGVSVSWEPKLLDAYGKTIMKTSKDGAINGSGLHTNMSFDTVDGKNAFVTYDEDGRPITNQLSEDAHLCIAGLLKHANGLQAIFNPSTISGARLGMGESPKFIVAGNDNRSALIRIVTIPVGEEFKTRIELRASDSMCCPHTWFAAAQMAMVDAIKSGRGKTKQAREALGLIPNIINTNFYQMPEKDRLEHGIPELHTGPDILRRSIHSFEGDHAYLLSPNGPFSEHFESVLKPYLDTIIEADRHREILRSVNAAKWIEAHAAAPSLEKHALTVDMQRLKDTLKASEARQDMLERILITLMGSLQVSAPSAHASSAASMSFFGSRSSSVASQSEGSSSSLLPSNPN
jgi:glutamine synthetase